MKNIRIERAANNIPTPTGNPVNYQFSYMDFSKVEVIGMKKFLQLPQQDADLKKLMRGKQALICIHNIGDCDNGEDSCLTMLNSSDREHYAKMTSCKVTPYGSIIPQIIIPSHNQKCCDNGLVFQSNQKESRRDDEGYNWQAKPITTGDTANSEFSTDVNDVRTYGERWPHKFVTNENSGRNSVDVDGIYHDREYRCDTSDSKDKGGAFAFCYKFIHANSQEQTKRKPHIQLKISGQDDDDLDANIVIPANGRTLVSVGQYFGEGAFSKPESDILPIQCSRNPDGFDTIPMFLYPLFGGFVVSASAGGSAEKTKSETIFVRYEDLDTDVRNRAIPSNVQGRDTGFPHVNINFRNDNELTQYYRNDKENFLMKWFPALYQETSNKDQLRVKVPDGSREGLDLSFDRYVNVKWVSGVGRFGYCPLFFFGRPRLTMFFKGAYRKNTDESNSTGNPNPGNKTTYWFIPLVCAGVGRSRAGIWGEGEDAMINKEGAKRVQATWVTNDEDIQESIYRVDFWFQAVSTEESGSPRYPLEIFGAICIYENSDVQFDVDNDNGDFDFSQQFREEFVPEVSPPAKDEWTKAITGCSFSYSLDDISGSVDIDGYAFKQGIAILKQKQSVGELCFDIFDENGESHHIFSGYGMEIGTKNNGNSNNITIDLSGVGKKLEDIKLVCCPFWDGDKLSDICQYMEAIANVKIYMIDHTVKSYLPDPNDDLLWSKKEVPYGNHTSDRIVWRPDSTVVVNKKTVTQENFRVPRSVDWRNPAVRFENNTSVLEALSRLGEMTGCKFVVEPDGSCVFYELNDYGYPYYVDNQRNAVVIKPSDIVSFDLSPSLEHKFNTIVTFGFLQRRNAQGKVLAEQNVEPGAFYTRFSDENESDLRKIGDIRFPWSRVNVGTETGMFTTPELAEIHSNRVKFSVSDIYKGSVTVKGRCDINHMYQKIQIGNFYFFVISISHNVDLSSKQWTTSYGLTYFNEPWKDGQNAQ